MYMDDLLWLAGLLEGEGSFCAPSPSKPHYPFISLAMTDRDVVGRVAAMLETSVRVVQPQKSGWKVQYRMLLRGRRAGVFMWKLYPLMGQRRQAQIVRALTLSRPTSKPWSHRLCTFPGCGRKHYSLGYCSLHYQRQPHRREYNRRWHRGNRR